VRRHDRMEVREEKVILAPIWVRLCVAVNIKKEGI
jgi:hypothetical protein